MEFKLIIWDKPSESRPRSCRGIILLELDEGANNDPESASDVQSLDVIMGPINQERPVDLIGFTHSTSNTETAQELIDTIYDHIKTAFGDTEAGRQWLSVRQIIEISVTYTLSDVINLLERINL